MSTNKANDRYPAIENYLATTYPGRKFSIATVTSAGEKMACINVLIHEHVPPYGSLVPVGYVTYNNIKGFVLTDHIVGPSGAYSHPLVTEASLLSPDGAAAKYLKKHYADRDLRPRRVSCDADQKWRVHIQEHANVSDTWPAGFLVVSVRGDDITVTDDQLFIRRVFQKEDPMNTNEIDDRHLAIRKHLTDEYPDRRLIIGPGVTKHPVYNGAVCVGDVTYDHVQMCVVADTIAAKAAAPSPPPVTEAGLLGPKCPPSLYLKKHYPNQDLRPVRAYPANSDKTTPWVIHVQSFPCDGGSVPAGSLVVYANDGHVIEDRTSYNPNRDGALMTTLNRPFPVPMPMTESDDYPFLRRWHTLVAPMGDGYIEGLLKRARTERAAISVLFPTLWNSAASGWSSAEEITDPAIRTLIGYSSDAVRALELRAEVAKLRARAQVMEAGANTLAPLPLPNVSAPSVWENDAIQFPRLLAEIWAAGVDVMLYKRLEVSMSLEQTQITDLFLRAEAAREKIKEKQVK